MKIRLPLLYEVVVDMLEVRLDELNPAPFLKLLAEKITCFIELANYNFNNCFLHYVISITL